MKPVDGMVYGRLFLANPEQPVRFRRGGPLSQPDSSTFCTPGAEGCVECPALEYTPA